MLSVGNLMKVKQDAVLPEFLCHQLRLFEWHISVGCAMDQHGRRISRTDILERHERPEFLRFHAGIPPRYSLRPLTGLSAEIGENAAVTLSFPVVGYRLIVHLLPCFFLRIFLLIVA